MKYLSILLAITTLSISPTLLADETDSAATANAPAVEESNDSALTELCNTYAEEDGIADSKKAAYLQECMSSMTDLSENMQEDLPVTAEATGEALATPASAHANSSPETLVQNELVETPDPAAEQLNAAK